MVLADAVVVPSVSWLGRLAVDRGWLVPQELELALAEQLRRDEAGRHDPLGAILVERGLVDPRRLGELLVAQQRLRRRARPAPPRLSRHENVAIGAWLIDAGIVDAAAIEHLTRLQREALRDGDHKMLGEIALERDLVPAGRLFEVTAWMLDPFGAGGRFAASPDQARLLALFVAAHESTSDLGRFQVIVQRSAVAGEAGRVFGIAPDRPMLIGRDVPTGLTIDDPLVSRVHAQLAIDAAGQLVVTDLGSGDGVFAAGERVGTARLASGDAFRIGGTILSFHDREREPACSTLVSILAELEIGCGDDRPGADPAMVRRGGTVAQIDRVRAIFREFYARESQLRLLGGNGGALPPTARASVVPARGIAPPPTRASRRRLAPSRVSWRRRATVVSGVFAVAVAIAVGTATLTRRAVASPPWVPEAVRGLRLPPLVPPPAEAAGAGSYLDDRTFTATIHRSRVLRGPGGDLFAGFLVHEGRTFACEVAVDRLDTEVRLRLPLPEGALVRVRGREAPYVGPGALLPDGSRARTRLELESLAVLEAP